MDPNYLIPNGAILFFYVTLGAEILLEAYLEMRGRGKMKYDDDHYSGYVMSILVISAFLFGLYASMHQWWFMHGDWEDRIEIGSAIIWIGIILRVWSVRSLGRFFRPIVVIQDGHRLVKRGPYKYVRHPSYTAVLIIFTGLIFVWSTWLGLLSFLLVWLAMIQRIRVEEKVLSERLHPEYGEYIENTKKFLPFIF